eukprot:COSAG01_NODE_41_length_32446_cov_41.218877_34_plen_42_part_00
MTPAADLQGKRPPPETEAMEWARLTPDQRTAALALGYTDGA